MIELKPVKWLYVTDNDIFIASNDYDKVYNLTKDGGSTKIGRFTSLNTCRRQIEKIISLKKDDFEDYDSYIEECRNKILDKNDGWEGVNDPDAYIREELRGGYDET